MKKLIICLTLLAAMTFTLTSCKKDKDPEQLYKDITNKDWHGYMDTYKENGSEWRDMGERTFLVIRFNGNKGELNGTGYQVEFDNPEMAGNPSDKNSFRWEIANGELHIAYINPGWTDVWIDYNNCTVSDDSFVGEMYDHHDHMYKFYFKPGIAINWAQYGF